MSDKLSTEDLRMAHKLYLSIYLRHAAGCCWHVVLDDGNVSDSSVTFCINYTRKCGERHLDCEALEPLILRMSPTQRKKLARGGYAALAAARKETP